MCFQVHNDVYKKKNPATTKKPVYSNRQENIIFTIYSFYFLFNIFNNIFTYLFNLCVHLTFIQSVC